MTRSRLTDGLFAAALTMVLSFSPAPCFAQGGPPMLTDDPGTPGSGAWEINFAYTEKRDRQQRLRSFPHVDFNTV